MGTLTIGLRMGLTLAVLVSVLMLAVQRRPVFSVWSFCGMSIALAGVLASLGAFVEAGVMFVLHGTTVAVALLVTNSMLGSRKESRRARSLQAMIPAFVWAGAIVAILARFAAGSEDFDFPAVDENVGVPVLDPIVGTFPFELTLPLLAIILAALPALIAGRVLTAADTEEDS